MSITNTNVRNLREPEKLEPVPYTWNNAITVVDNEIYKIEDLAIKDTLGRTAFTMSKTHLHQGQQTSGHVHDHEIEIYEFLSGTGLMGLDKKFLRVEPDYKILVEPNVFHIVINLGHEDLIFNCMMRGTMKRPHLNQPKR